MINPPLHYRPEIDGLRALAVLPVIFYHAGFNFISGGFLDVDVFFVISGYLITSILLQDLQKGSFSLITFYERRIRRIIPMLVTVIIACLPFAWFFMTPQDLLSFGHSLLSSLYYVSNIYFWQTINYFNPSSDELPLLHTWSLSIEEQFYIFFPLTLMICFRFFKRAILALLIIGFILSLSLAEYASYHYPQANFFLLPTRAWELMAGAITALIMVNINHLSMQKAQILSFIGFTILCLSYLILNHDMGMPGVLSLFPVMGTCLIIAFARQGTLTAKILSFKPVIFIGLISYSLYLWHQPIFAFARIYFWDDIGVMHYWALMILTGILSVASWKWIEQPFRQKDRFTRRAIFTYFLFAMVLISAIGAGIHFYKGFPQRNNQTAKIQIMEDRLVRNAGLAPNCNNIETTPVECQTHKNPTVLLWGDSYAMHLAQGLLAHDPEIKMIQKTASICGPFFEASPIILPRYNVTRAKKCIAFNNKIRTYIKQTQSIQYVVMSSPFEPYLNPNGYSYYKGQLYRNTQWPVIEAFRDTLEWIKSQGKAPIVISPPPKTGRNFKKCYARMINMGRSPQSCDFSIETHQDFSSITIDFLKKFNQDYTVIDMADTLCDDNICKTYDDENDIYYYNDDGHLSIEGSISLGQQTNLFNLNQY